jgi:RecA/RadA recombinase
MFYHEPTMITPDPTVGAALATLRARWGGAAPRQGREAFGPVVPGGPEVEGALAVAPLPHEAPSPMGTPSLARPAAVPVVGTGFPALDALLGPGGVPRTASLALRGRPSSGRTTLALRLLAEAQAGGAIGAWLDVDRVFDPVEAVARGVRLEWLVVLAPADLDEGLALAGSLLGARAVDLLVVDLPARLGRAARPGGGAARVAERLTRLTALARRAGTMLVVLDGAERSGAERDGTDPLTAAVGLRLDLVRRSWIRLGRDVVGQRTEVTIARNRFGPPGRRAEIRILYAEGGPRDACLRADALLADGPPGVVGTPEPPTPTRLPVTTTDATPPPPLAAPPAPIGPATFRVVPGGAGHPRRPAVDRRDGPGRRSGGPGTRRPAGDAARDGAPARPGGDLPRPGSGR